jgi:hypothetical protein
MSISDNSIAGRTCCYSLLLATGQMQILESAIFLVVSPTRAP